MGIVPRMMNAVFEQILQADEKIEFTVKVSYLEIYCEKLNDLLNSKDFIRGDFGLIGNVNSVEEEFKSKRAS